MVHTYFARNNEQKCSAIDRADQRMRAESSCSLLFLHTRSPRHSHNALRMSTDDHAQSPEAFLSGVLITARRLDEEALSLERGAQ